MTKNVDLITEKLGKTIKSTVKSAATYGSIYLLPIRIQETVDFDFSPDSLDTLNKPTTANIMSGCWKHYTAVSTLSLPIIYYGNTYGYGDSETVLKH